MLLRDEGAHTLVSLPAKKIIELNPRCQTNAIMQPISVAMKVVKNMTMASVTSFRVSSTVTLIKDGPSSQVV